MSSVIGRKYGRLHVIRKDVDNQGKSIKYICKCECGNEVSVIRENLIKGHTRSCGCLKEEIIKAGAHKIHGMSKTRIYRIWKDMRRRCNNPSRINYHRYGGRGINVCEDWNTNFVAFYDWAMNNGYQDNLSIDRIDNDAGYYPNNCRWVSNTTQANNRRNNRYLEFEGKKRTISEWSSETGLSQTVIESRLNLGWDVKRTLTTPLRQRDGRQNLDIVKTDNGSKVVY